MTWQVEEPVRMGATCAAAVVWQSVSVRAGETSIAGLGQRRPVLILVLTDGKPQAFDLFGQHMDEVEVERRYPSALTQFMDAVREGGMPSAGEAQ